MSVSADYYVQPQRPGMRRRIVGVLVGIVIITVTAFLIYYGYIIDTVWFYNLQSLPLYSQLPAPAQTAFGAVTSWSLTSYNFLVGVIIILAICIGIAAIFGLQSPIEDTEESM